MINKRQQKELFYFHSVQCEEFDLSVMGDLHIDSRTQCVIMTQITWPPHSHPLLYASFPDFRENK